MFNGSIAALITPFRQGNVDEQALKNLVRFHIENGSHAIVPLGTTGEASTLSKQEYKQVVELVCHEVSNQLPVIAGAGSNCLDSAIEYTAIAKQAGVNAALHVMGYYNRPNQEGIYQHFAQLTAATDLPIIVYNIPSRAVIDILPETMARIAQLPTIVGVKDATCDLSRPIREAALISKPFCFLTGEDPTAVAYNAQGGVGCISVTANIAPALCADMQKACANQQFDKALEIQRRLMPLHRALFIEPSPAGVKYASSLLGLCEDTCRLPMVPLTQDTKQKIAQAMRLLDLIE